MDGLTTIRWGEEGIWETDWWLTLRQEMGNLTPRCNDCGVAVGEHHQPFCDNAECDKHHRQLIGCEECQA